MTTNNQWIEDEEIVVSRFPVHPGDLLRREILPARNVTAVALAQAMGASRPDVSAILNGKKPITPLMARRLEAALGYPAIMLLRLQNAHDLAAIDRDQAERIASIPRIVECA